MTDGGKSRGGKRWLRTLFAVITVGALGGSGIMWLDHRGIDLREAAIGFFKPESIDESFSQWRDHQISGNQGNILEVATATSMEKFSRRSHMEFFGTSLMPKNSSIEVPATYRFYIDLLGAWEIEANQPRLIVTAPPPQPSFPVAFDTTGIKKSVDGWGKYMPTRDMEELEKSISGELAKRAGDPDMLMQVRDESRRSIALFLQTWLFNEARWREGQFEELVILFEGEIPAQVGSALQLETTVLD
jgi:hypothetical protein